MTILFGILYCGCLNSFCNMWVCECVGVCMNGFCNVWMYMCVFCNVWEFVCVGVLTIVLVFW